MDVKTIRIVSVYDAKNNEKLFFETLLNKDSISKTDPALSAIYLENKYSNVTLYDVELKPTDLSSGYFCPVIYKPDGEIVLLETHFEFATYEDCKKRLETIKFNGFIVKLHPTNYCIFSIDKNTNKKIVVSGLDRIEAKSKIKELNKKSSLLDFDYEIEEEYLKNN